MKYRKRMVNKGVDEGGKERKKERNLEMEKCTLKAHVILSPIPGDGATAECARRGIWAAASEEGPAGLVGEVALVADAPEASPRPGMVSTASSKSRGPLRRSGK